MSFNLVDLVKDQMGGQALGQLGALLGEDNNKTEAAFGAAVPGLLHGLTGAANADGGASLFNAVNDADDGLLDNIGGLLTGGNSGNVMNQGSNLLGSLLGNGAMGGLASAVAGLTGIGGKSSSGLMGILTPIILGIIKRKLFGGGGGFAQNAGGLLSMLNGQRNHVEAAMPAGFGNQLQSSGFMDQIASLGGNVGDAVGNTVGAAGDAVSNTASSVGHAAGNAVDGVGNAVDGVGDAAGHAASSGGGFLKKLLPLALLVGLAFLAWNFFKGKDVAAPDVSGAASSAADSVKAAIPSIDVDGTDIGAEFGNVFGTATSTVQGITDVDTAKAALPAFEDLTGKVDGLGGLWDKAPEAGRGQLSGMISDNLGTLTPALDKVKEIPGVGDIIGPATGPLMEKLMGFVK